MISNVLNRLCRPASAVLFVMLASASSAGFAQGQAPWVGESFAEVQCFGQPTGNFGPFDYRTRKDKLPIVENYHFKPEMEQLRFGRLQDSMDNIRYTITKFPNHHRALYSAVRFSLMSSASRSLKRTHPAECYLQRAIAYAPNDSVPYQLFGLYLHRLDQPEQALPLYRKAVELSPRDPMLRYNFGLVLMDLKQYDEALTQAQVAYGAGIEFPGLRSRLERQGFTLPDNSNP